MISRSTMVSAMIGFMTLALHLCLPSISTADGLVVTRPLLDGNNHATAEYEGGGSLNIEGYIEGDFVLPNLHVHIDLEDSNNNVAHNSGPIDLGTTYNEFSYNMGPLPVPPPNQTLRYTVRIIVHTAAHTATTYDPFIFTVDVYGPVEDDG